MTAGPAPTATLARCAIVSSSRGSTPTRTRSRTTAARSRGPAHASATATHEVTAAEVAEWVAELAQTYKPGTVQQYLIALRLLLDFAAVDPNVARDPRVKLPK